MSLLDESFEELLAKIREPGSLDPARSDPLFYLVYPPELMLDLKQRYARWTARLRERGFEVVRISLSEAVWELVDESGRWDAWLEIEPEVDLSELNEAMRDVLGSEALVERVARQISGLSGNKLVLITETEMLHPYFRSRALENRLHDRIPVPTVIFYPGRRSGLYGLQFLDCYPVDANYRSEIVGGL